MVKLQQLRRAGDNRSFVNIPKEYIKWKGWKKGTELVLGFNKRGNLVIAEATSQPADGKAVVFNLDLADRQTHAAKKRLKDKKV